MSATELHTTAGVDIEELNHLSHSESSEESRQQSVSSSTTASRYSLLVDGVYDPVNSNNHESVIFSLKEAQGDVWLDCQNCPVEEIAAICDAAFGGLHPLTVELLHEPPPRDILQEVKSYLFTTFGPINVIILFDRGIISITRGASLFRERIQQRLHRSLAFTPDWICYALIDQMTHQMLPTIRAIDDHSTWVNDHVYVDFDDASGKAVLDKLAETRASVVLLLMQLRSKIEIVESLCGHRANDEVVHYFVDAKDSLLTMKYRLEAHETVLANTHRNWMAVTQMNLEKTKTKVLAVVGMFLSLTTVFVPMLTVFTSGHMNLEGPGMGDGSSHNSLAWWGTIVGVVCGLAAIVVSLSYRFFRYIMSRPAPSLTGEFK